MGVNPGLYRISIRGTILGQRWQNSQVYDINNVFGTSTPVVALCEAYWTHIRSDLRATLPAYPDVAINSIYAEEMTSGGGYAEYAIPLSESTGTRPTETLGGLLPPFIAASVRLAVSSRVTRPGQKRFVGLCEVDNAGGVMAPGIRGQYNLLAQYFVQTLTLPAPMAFTTLTPMIVRLNPETGAVVASQPVVSAYVNPNISTQNSRKYGRGQ